MEDAIGEPGSDWTFGLLAASSVPWCSVTLIFLAKTTWLAYMHGLVQRLRSVLVLIRHEDKLHAWSLWVLRYSISLYAKAEPEYVRGLKLLMSRLLLTCRDQIETSGTVLLTVAPARSPAR